MYLVMAQLVNLRKYIDHQLKNCLISTSVKGIGRFLKSETTVQKLVWFAAVLFGCIIGIYQLSCLVSRYNEFKVTTVLNEESDKDLFPDITICPNGLITNTKDSLVETYYRKTKRVENYLEEKNLTNSRTGKMFLGDLQSSFGFYVNWDPKEHLNFDYSNSNVQYLIDCDWRSGTTGFLQNCPRSMKSIISNAFYGVCMTINLPKDSEVPMENNPYEVTAMNAILYFDDFISSLPVITNMRIEDKPLYITGYKVFLSPPGHRASFYGRIIGMGKFTALTAKATRWTHLSKPYSQCQSVSEKHSNKEISEKLEEAFNSDQILYSEEMCVQVVVQMMTIRKCGCLNGYHFATRKQMLSYPFCGRINENLTLSFQRYLCARDIEKPSKGKSRKDEVTQLCPNQCETISYDVSLSQVSTFRLLVILNVIYCHGLGLFKFSTALCPVRCGFSRCCCCNLIQPVP